MTSFGSCSCNKIPEERKPEKVMIFYAAGFNSISSYISQDVKDLKSGYLPGNEGTDDVLLVYSHFTKGSYSNPQSPVLVQLYRSSSGDVVSDTLKVYDPGTITASAEQVNEVLSFVNEKFPAKSYGLIFSSHGFGYLPAGYYSNSEKFEKGEISGVRMRSSGPAAYPYVEPETDPSLPPLKSVGEDVVVIDGEKYSYEIDIKDMADAIPMHLDYILFDACLMGGIEVAYQFRDKCDYMGFSAAEVLAEGFNYKTVASHLLMPSSPQPQKVCEDYFEYYDSLSGLERSATISFVDCRRLGDLAEVCSRLFSEYEEAIAGLDPDRVQRFFRSKYHWFYDLESILVQAGISDADKAELKRALDGCVLYKAATEDFIGAFDIDTFCGFSMFLPCNGGNYLKDYYKGLAWNKATGLVK